MKRINILLVLLLFGITLLSAQSKSAISQSDYFVGVQAI